ncbi:MAG: hydrogenase formation protein HypD [Nitrospirota bacterium]
MKFIDEYRDAAAARDMAAAIRRITTRPWTVMEVCGGQTHAIVRFGLDELLPEDVTLLHGPGCPVCVTPIALIDAAIELASRHDAVVCSFGDMLRVPGSARDLLSVKAEGGDVRIVYSPLDALDLARRLPDREVVFFAVGFETTAPANAMAVYRAQQEGVANFSILVAHVLVPPALAAIMASPGNRVNGFLAAGHVCAVMGYTEYEPLAARFQVPIVVTGFEPLDILHGMYLCVKQLEDGRAEVENQYARAVRRDGNREALAILREVFEVSSRTWRGIGEIAESGLALRPEYARYDALRRWDVASRSDSDHAECVAGEILLGAKVPTDCAAFGSRCTPDHPLGAPMVSSEGACAAYYRYRPPTLTPARGEGTKRDSLDQPPPS